MAKEDKVNPHQINIEISQETAEGIYSNLAVIVHSHAEFIIDFVNVMPNMPHSKVKSRIICTPANAKRFLQALAENVRHYESAYGEIKENPQAPIDPQIMFGNIEMKA